MPRTHRLKTWPSFYEALASGEKTFEVRRNDRDYAVGDMLHLKEFDPTGWSGTYTGREMTRTITYVMPGGRFGIDPLYCVLGLSSTPDQT